MTEPKTYWLASLISRNVVPILVLSEAYGFVLLENHRRAQMTTENHWIRPTFEEARQALENALREQMFAAQYELDEAWVRLRSVEAMESPEEGDAQ
jgi:hypothetical protein